MKTSEALYAAANYIREHGFDPHWHVGKGCGCFAHALVAAAKTADGLHRIEQIIDCDIDRYVLQDNGWTPGCTEDAAAACEIAADIAAAEGV